MKRLFLILFCIFLPAVTLAERTGSTGNSDLSDASVIVGSGAVLVVAGSVVALAGAGEVVVASVTTVADGVVVVLKGASNASEVVLKFSGKAVSSLSTAVGAGVSVVAVSTGYLLVAAGEVISFIPNEIGKSLLHHSGVK